MNKKHISWWMYVGTRNVNNRGATEERTHLCMQIVAQIHLTQWEKKLKTKMTFIRALYSASVQRFWLRGERLYLTAKPNNQHSATLYTRLLSKYYLYILYLCFVLYSFIHPIHPSNTPIIYLIPNLISLLHFWTYIQIYFSITRFTPQPNENGG